MANEGGPGCQNLAAGTNGNTFCSNDTCSVAGTILSYEGRLLYSNVVSYNYEFSLQTKNGTFSYIDGTETGVKSTPTGSIEWVCKTLTAPGDFTAGEASVGDYVSMYYQGTQERSDTGGDGYWYSGTFNRCEASGWTGTEDTNGDGDVGFGVTIQSASGINLFGKDVDQFGKDVKPFGAG